MISSWLKTVLHWGKSFHLENFKIQVRAFKQFIIKLIELLVIILESSLHTEQYLETEKYVFLKELKIYVEKWQEYDTNKWSII